MRRVATAPLLAAAVATLSSWCLLQGVAIEPAADVAEHPPARDAEPASSRVVPEPHPSDLIARVSGTFPPGPGRVVGRVRVADGTPVPSRLDGFDPKSRALRGVLVYLPSRPRDVTSVTGGQARVMQLASEGGVGPRTIVLHPDQQLRFSNLRNDTSLVTWFPRANPQGEVWLAGHRIGGPGRLQNVPGVGTLSSGWTMFSRLEPRPFPIEHAGGLGSVHVLDHTFFSITNERGAFEIADLPYPEHRLAFWHPDAERGPLTLDIEIVGQGTRRITIRRDRSDLPRFDLVTPNDDGRHASTKGSTLDAAVWPAAKTLAGVLFENGVHSARVEALEGRYFSTAAAHRLVQSLERRLGEFRFATGGRFSAVVFRMYPLRHANGRHEFLVLARGRGGQSLGREKVVIELADPIDRAMLESRTYDTTADGAVGPTVDREQPGRFRPSKGSPYGIEIVSTGRQDWPIAFDDRAGVFGLDPDQSFAVAIVNDSARAVAVHLSVDGLDVWQAGSERSGATPSTDAADHSRRLFVVAPHGRVLVPGWLASDLVDSWHTRFGPAPPHEGRGQVTAVLHRMTAERTDVDRAPIAAITVPYARTGDHTETYEPIRIARPAEHERRGSRPRSPSQPEWSPPPLPPPWPRLTYAPLASTPLEEIRTILADSSDEAQRRMAARAIVSRFSADEAATDFARLAIDEDPVVRGIGMRRLWADDTRDSRLAATLAVALKSGASVAHLSDLVEEIEAPVYSFVLLPAVLERSEDDVPTLEEYAAWRWRHRNDDRSNVPPRHRVALARTKLERDPLDPDAARDYTIALLEWKSLAEKVLEVAEMFDPVLAEELGRRHAEAAVDREDPILRIRGLSESIPRKQRETVRCGMLRILAEPGDVLFHGPAAALLTADINRMEVLDRIRGLHRRAEYGTRRSTLRWLLLQSKQISERERRILLAEESGAALRTLRNSLREVVEAQSELVGRTKATQLDELVDALRDLED